jgi:Insertion element 4 transposase N-terminal
VVAGDRLPDRIGIGVLAKVFPPELVDRVVDEAGVREQRKRTLPARVVVYLLLAMVLFFQSGYGEVWDKLVRGLEWARQFRVRVAAGMQPSPAAVTQARQRLGWQVMARLLEAVAGPLAGEEQQTAYVAGMRLVAIDGMCLDVPATEENGAEFGYPGNDAGPGPFPQVRVVGVGECGTRAVLGAELSPLAAGEQPLAVKLLGRLAPGDLVLADRNFLSHGLLSAFTGAGVHVLWRARSDVDLPVLEVLPDGTYLSRIADPAASKRMRRKAPPPRTSPASRYGSSSTRWPAATAPRSPRPSPWSPTSPIPPRCPRSRPRMPIRGAGSWRPASVSWRPPSAAGRPSSCARSRRR